MSKQQIADHQKIELIKSLIPNLTTISAIKLFARIVNLNFPVRIKDIIPEHAVSKFIKQNSVMIENHNNVMDATLTQSIIDNIINRLNEYNTTSGMQFDPARNIVEEKYKSQRDIAVSKKLNKNIIDSILSKQPDTNFMFNPTLGVKELDVTSGQLQTIVGQVSSGKVPLSYPIQFVYRCHDPRCLCYEHKRYMYEVISTDNKSRCPNYITNASGKTTKCNTLLKPVMETSTFLPVYFLTVTVYYDGEHHTLNAISLVPLNPGTYHLHLLVTHGHQPQLFIISKKRTEVKHLDCPQLSHEKHRIEQLRETFDSYIKEGIGVELTGYHAMKEMYIVQNIAQKVFNINNFNIALIGEKGLGKTFIAKMYLPCLTNNYLITEVNSISIPTLRGTSMTVTMVNKDIKILSIGALGTYDTIYIDELFEDEKLFNDLKSALSESDYGNFKANGDGVKKKKRAQFIISGNIKKMHMMFYRKRVRAFYTALAGNESLTEESSLLFDDKRDLFQRLKSYSDDKLLQRAIRSAREEFMINETNWIDGMPLPAVDRFKYIFYMKSNKKYTDDNITRDIENALNTNKSDVELAKLLKNDLLDKEVAEIISRVGKNPSIRNLLSAEEIRILRRLFKEFVDKYELDAESRGTKTFTLIAVVLKLINRENTISEMTIRILDKYYSLQGKMVTPAELCHDYDPSNDKSNDPIDSTYENIDLTDSIVFDDMMELD